MRLFYIATLVAGVAIVGSMHLISYALPSDALVAGVLVGQPDAWSLEMAESMTSRLSSHDVKAEVTLALAARVRLFQEVHKPRLWPVVLIVFSIIGLIRERQLRRLKGSS